VTNFQRARRPEQKAQRYDAILAAARSLGLERGVRVVTLTDIAAEVGIHKSAVLRYFETREQIYLHLTAEGWQDWVHALHTELTVPSEMGEPGSARSVSAEELAEVLARTLVERPLFCELLAHAPLHLERNVSRESVREFKLTALAAVEEFRALVVGAVPAIGDRGAADLIAAVNALAASLWQTSHPPETLAQLYAEDPRLAHAVVDLRPRLERLILTVIRGLLTE
jgi:AcrR family transcriptional regulator